MYWNEAAETMPREALARLQLARLQAMVARVVERVPHYRDAFARAGVTPSDVRSLEDLSRLPLTTKDDLRTHYPFGLFAVPQDEIVRVHASSGTTGKPTVVGYTRRDMGLWAEVMARSLTAGGVTASDVVHNAFGYGLFTGGLGLGLGAETIGATTVPVSGGLTRRQLMLMEDFGATVLCCTPSYALVLAEAIDEAGDTRSRPSRLRVGFMGAEPYSEAVRRGIERRLGLEVHDIYGLSEIIGPGVAIECSQHEGLHIFEDHFLPETVDPGTGAPLPRGSAGELVLTSLTREAMPLVRFRTRDRVRLVDDPCGCGRTLVRMTRVHGRTDDMLIVRGVNVFPSQIEEALLAIEDLAPQYQIVVDRDAHGMDRIEVLVEPAGAGGRLDAEVEHRLQERATGALHQALGLRVQVRVVGSRSLPRSEGKAVRVVDRRAR